MTKAPRLLEPFVEDAPTRILPFLPDLVYEHADLLLEPLMQGITLLTVKLAVLVNDTLTLIGKPIA